MLTLKYDEKSVLGTADYVAPEQTVNSHEVDVRADIYSMGATFYFLLAGHPPFPEGTIAQKLIAHQTKTPTPIRQIRPEVSEAIASVLDRMMAKSLDDRFQTPAEVYEAFLPHVLTQISPPPDEEMPILSPAARESLAGMAAGMSGSMSGSFRQDSAIYRANLMQQSGRMAPPVKVGDSNPGAPKVPGGSSVSIRNPFYTASTGQGGSSKVSPTAPVGGRGIPSETNRMNNTERSTPPPLPTNRPQQRPAPRRREQEEEPTTTKGLLSQSVVRVLVESILVLAIVSLIWWIIQK
jgi:serine/threonine protein kinase